MGLWMIEPRDPFAARDGRPNNGRSQSVGLAFPFPSAIAGMIRTRLGSDKHGLFDVNQDLERLRRVAVRGPLLTAPQTSTFYVRPPRDALVVSGNIQRLVPTAAPGVVYDEGLMTMPVALAPRCESPPAQEPSNKHKGEIMAWWPWEVVERWVAEPDVLDGARADQMLAGALPPLPTESRLHVAIGETWTNDEGMLYETAGLRLVTPQRMPLALGVDVDVSACAGAELRSGVGPGGGKRRLVRWEPAPASLSLPGLSGQVEATLAGGDEVVRVRVILLTPASFAAGWRPGSAPGQLLGLRCSVVPTLVAAYVPRPETLSGWDFAKRQPKGTRRAVSAGSVYWLDLRGTPNARVDWAKEITMANVSDAEQDRRDGFGLAVVGVAQ